MKKKLENEKTKVYEVKDEPNRQEGRNIGQEQHGTPNIDVNCRLRVSGIFGVRSGEKQHCLMLNRTMNVTFQETKESGSFFNCKECTDPQKRDDRLEFYREQEQPDCAMCGKNMATRKITKDYKDYRPPHQVFQAGSMVCISCVKNVEYQMIQEQQQVLEEKLREVEQDYADGKIPYVEVLDLKREIEDLRTTLR